MKLMNISLYLGITIVMANSIFHLFGMTHLMSPLGLGSYQTIFTSVSFLSLFLFFHPQLELHKSCLLQLSITSQVLSILLLLFNIETSSHYFLSSSIPTTFFVLIMCLACYLMEKSQYQLSKLHTVFNLFFILFSFTMLFALMTKNLYFLGISQSHAGVGVSLYTSLCFLLTTLTFYLKFCSTIKLKPLQIAFYPRSSFLVLVGFSVLNFLLVFCTGDSKVLTALFVQALFISTSYLLYLAPFQNEGKKPMVVCAWSNQVKIENPRQKAWGSINDLYNQIGLDVSHGISPDAKQKIRRRKSKTH